MLKKNNRFDLPVKAHIRKYLHCQYGYPLQLSHQHQLGTILLTLLEKNSTCGLSPTDRRKRMKRLTATVECFFALHHGLRRGMDISEQQIININRILEARFEQELHAYVKHNTGPTGRYPGYMEALRGFMKDYHISEELDLPLDTLKKMEYRHRQQLKKNREKLMQAEPIINHYHS